VTPNLRKPTAGSASGGALPVLALGFRPFFLLTSLFAALAMPLWLLVLQGQASLPTRLAPVAWHSHEMVFGFAGGVIAGFLLTAVRNWTGQPTPSGAGLAVLVGLWLLGRIAVLLDGVLPPALAATLDLSFLPAVAVSIARPIVRARNFRNLGFIGLLGLLFGANLLFHLGPPEWASRATRLGVDVVLLVIVVMGGRVIPTFTGNALGVTVSRSPLLDWGSLASMALVTAADLSSMPARLAGVTSLVAGALNGARMLRWHSLSTRRTPILWVLHVGYAWLAVGLVLQGLAAFVPSWIATAPTHALTVGAIGVLILGMTSRVSLGHTGRMLVVSRPIAAAFGLLVLSAVVRSLGPLVLPAAYVGELVVSGVLWTAAFGVFVVVHAPILTSRRVDGKPG
jgi:uncharacterized protein involved in response to NO